MSIEFVRPLQRGWDRMKAILFQPFDLGTWLVIGFSVWLARLVRGSGGGGGTGWSGPGDGSSWRRGCNDLSGAWQALVEHAVWLPLVLILLMVVVAVILALVWLSSRGKLVFLDNVVHGRGRIVEPWTRLARQGNSLFLWRVGFGLAVTFVIGLLVLLMLAPVVGLSWNDTLSGLSIASMVLGGMLVGVIAVAVAVVSLFLDSFVVPIMYRYDLTTTAAWRYFLPWLSAYPAYFVLYTLLVLLLYIGLVVVTVLLCLFTCCLVAIPLLGSYIEAVVLLPLWITYRAFTVEFLAQLDPGFDLFAPAAASDDQAPSALVE